MRRLLLTAFAAFCALLLCGPAAKAGAAGADDAVRKIQAAYEGITDLKGAFSQKSVIKDLKKTEQYKGEFFIKPPLKMKWIYKGKTAQELTINKETVLIVKRDEKQAYRSRFDREGYGQTPVVLLTGFGKITDEFEVSGTAENVTLRPKRPMGNIRSIRIALSEEGEFPIRSFFIIDSRSNTIEINLKDIIVNSGIMDSVFDLTVPKGMNVFEQ